jgi:hypothetical protein
MWHDRIPLGFARPLVSAQTIRFKDFQKSDMA